MNDCACAWPMSKCVLFTCQHEKLQFQQNPSNSYGAPAPLHYTTHCPASEIIAIKVMQTSLCLAYFLAAPHLHTHTHTCIDTASYMPVCVWLIYFDP